MATIVTSGAASYDFIRMNAGAKYFILENLIFDATADTTDSNNHEVVYMFANTAGPVKIRYCAIIGGDSGTVSTGRRSLLHVYTGSSTDSFLVEYCYFQNCKSPIYTTNSYGGAKTVAKLDHCVGIWDATGRTTGWYADAVWTTSASNDVTITYNTFYESVGNNAAAHIFSYPANTGLSLGNCNVYSNLTWQDSTKTSDAIDQFLDGGSSDDTDSYSGFIGANLLIGGSNVASTDQATGGWYTGVWDAGNDPQTSDTALWETADTTIFNDPSSTYDWELPNGLTITILKDLRPIAYTTAGRFGGVPGALESAAEEETEPESPVDPNDTASVPYIDVLPLIGDDLQYSAVIRLGMTQNRAEHYYDRHDTEAKRWAEYAANTLELSTNSTTRIRMGGVETAEVMLIESTTPIQVSIGTESDTDLFFPETKMVAVKSSFEMVLVKNPSTTNSATITMVVVD